MANQHIKMEYQHCKMTQTPILKLVTSMAVPTVTSMLITIIYNTADTYFVEQIDKSASAAVKKGTYRCSGSTAFGRYNNLCGFNTVCYVFLQKTYQKLNI